MSVDRPSTRHSLVLMARAEVPAAEKLQQRQEVKQQRGAVSLPGLAPDVVERRNALGRAARRGEEPAQLGLFDDLVPPKYFRSYEQLKAAIVALQKKHPDLVDVVDIGDSYEKTVGKADRDLLVLRLTSKKGGDKPKVMHIGGQHAHEIVPPELLMRFATWLVENYGKDPEATALLDSREIDLLPMFNPDGHAVVERGFANLPDGNLFKRKNTSGEDGTDTNRNWDTSDWGKDGSSGDPHDETYAGPSAASESEVKAAQAYIEKIEPGLTFDWHSFSELILYPPEDDPQHVTPDQEHFVRVGKQLSSLNGYTPEAIVELYPTSGSSIWPYDRHGIGAFGIEVGQSFLSSDAEFASIWKKNFPVLMYTAKIADDWTKTSQGPQVRRVSVDERGRLTATAADMLTSKPAKAVEVVWDPQTPAGLGVSAVADKNGSFSIADVASAAPGEMVPTKKRLAYVRAMNDDGVWGPFTATWVSRAQPAMRPLAMRVAVAKQRQERAS